jgi:Uma2 family endonuclease
MRGYRGAVARIAVKSGIPYAEYVALEAESDTKHEWLRGDVFVLAWATPEHARLAANVAAELRVGLGDRPCSVYSADDLRVKVEATGLATYADVSVVCRKLERASEDPNAALNPVVIVEVLSDSNEAYDRGEKFRHYRQIPSLLEYVVVSQREPRIEVHRLNEAGHWELHEATAVGESVELTSLGCRLGVDEVYRDLLQPI